jgi:2-polyprenyl-3-methyl-5-hydroxy-6-metoxy-1,4-benzoquinol methylase
VNISLIERFLGELVSRKVNILDFGCGIGDKSIILKEIFRKANITALETKVNDDHYAVDHQPYKAYQNIYPILKRKYSINFKLYDGKIIDAQDNYFDIILLYAVIEHIHPEKRRDIINSLSNKLKKGGYLVITRCPSYYSLTEFVARHLGLTTHEWLLKKNELIGLFDKKKFEIVTVKKLSYIPSQPEIITNNFSTILITLDKILQAIRWPFASEFFLTARKNEY